jgi:dTDP-4-amino-4,6-dideoxygalactose transaminase/nucleoside-diphosphate-sugar epimerase
VPGDYDAVLLGGSGFIGSATAHDLVSTGRAVLSVDRFAPSVGDWLQADVLREVPALPAGPIAILLGGSDLRRRHLWTLVLDTVVATARILPALRDRDVTLVSSIEVYGAAPAPLLEDTEPMLPLGAADLTAWCDRVVDLAREPVPPWRAAALCRELVEADEHGRWGYGLAKRAQELLVASAVKADRLRILRVANVVGPGQHRVAARLVARAGAGLPLAVTGGVRTFATVAEVGHAVAQSLTGNLPAGIRNVGTRQLDLVKLADLVLDETGTSVPVTITPAPVHDSAGVVQTLHPTDGIDSDAELSDDLRRFIRDVVDNAPPPLRPTVPVVIPPRPFRPDVVAARQQDALWSGAVKHGNRWTGELTETLTGLLDVGEDREVLVTASGTAALRLGVLALAGPCRPGAVSVLPSFTFAATAEVLVQLGYRLRFCDVDPLTWTLDPDRLQQCLADDAVQVVVAVDTFGNPCDYSRLTRICADRGVPLVADSAPSFGASYGGAPIGTQAEAHAFSMSFAKVVSSGGAGGAVVLPRRVVAELGRGPNWLRSSMMSELSAVAALDLVGRLDDLSAARQQVAATYGEVLDRRPDVAVQAVSSTASHAWVHWVLAAHGTTSSGRPRRDVLMDSLAGLGVGTKPYYSPLLHTLAWDRSDDLLTREPLPVSTALEAEALALPMSSELSQETAEQIAFIVEHVLDTTAATESA